MVQKITIDFSSAEHTNLETNKILWHELLLMTRIRQYRVWRILALLHKQGQGLSAAGTSRVISERAIEPHLFCFWIQCVTNIVWMDVRTA